MPPHMHGNVKSLYLLTKNVLTKHVDSIDDIGDLDYALVRPVLLKITSPVQLKKLEANCPQIRGEDSEIWKVLIGKHFGQGALHKMELEKPKNWSKAYDELQKAADAAAAAATETLRARMTKMSSAKQQSRAKLLTSTVGLPPTGRPRSFGGGGGWGGAGNSWTVKAGSKTRNIIDKARREAKELSVFRGRNSVLAAPTHTLKRQEVDRKMKEKIMKKMGDAKDKGGEGEGEGGEAARRRNDDNNKRGRDDTAGGDDRGSKWISGADGKKIAVPKIGRNMSVNNGKATSFSLPSAPISTANIHPSRRAPGDPFVRRKK